MIIYRLTDRIPIQIGEIRFWVSPLSYEQKIRLSELTKLKGGKEVIDQPRVVAHCLKFSLKEVEGLTLADGSPYVLEFDPDGSLSDASVSELLQMEKAPKLMDAVASLANEIKEWSIPGVKIDLKSVRPAAKKN